MTGVATAGPCGHQYQWTEPAGAEPRWYVVDLMSNIYALPRCLTCGEAVVSLDVRISHEAGR